MTNEVAPGITRTRTYVTTPEMRARQLKADVFSTPAMIGLMELTCVDLTEPYLDPHEQTVGIHVDVRHMAPTKIGQKVTVQAELLELKDKKIGEGLHRRAVINTKNFGGEAETKS